MRSGSGGEKISYRITSLVCIYASHKTVQAITLETETNGERSTHKKNENCM
jgi:hypothetical protein